MRAALLMSGLMVVMSACDQFPRGDGAQEAEPRLGLSLDMSDVLDWGGAR